MTRRCLTCGQLTTRATRCALCEKLYQASRNHRRTIYRGDWETTSKQARQAEPWCHCSGCPVCTLFKDGKEGGCQDMDLTLDHQYRRVECRKCNAGHRRQPGQA